jgi:hypothetical protein
MTRIFLISVFLLTLPACVSNNYTVERQPMASAANSSGTSASPIKQGSNPSDPADQRIIFSLSDDFERDPPACAVVRAANPSSAESPLTQQVEQAVIIHLGGKLDQVIGGARRDRILRKQNLDLDHAGDARAFAWKTRCRAVLSWRLTTANETFLLAWGARQIGLELTLRRIGKSDILWQARHVTSRTGGGLPLSPVGLVIDTVRAGQFMDDRDMLPSMIHDVVRRLFTTLPDGF